MSKKILHTDDGSPIVNIDISKALILAKSIQMPTAKALRGADYG